MLFHQVQGVAYNFLLKWDFLLYFDSFKFYLMPSFIWSFLKGFMLYDNFYILIRIIDFAANLNLLISTFFFIAISLFVHLIFL